VQLLYLEESKLLGVGRGLLVDGSELLNDNVGVTNDLAIAVQLLRSCEVVLLSVHEVTSDQVLDGHTDGEGLVGLNVAEVLREDELGARHVVNGRNETNRSRVARTGRDLLAILNNISAPSF
jgi:hypothetical protein